MLLDPNEDNLPSMMGLDIQAKTAQLILQH